jgi:iduronate 2-sulfatase
MRIGFDGVGRHVYVFLITICFAISSAKAIYGAEPLAPASHAGQGSTAIKNVLWIIADDLNTSLGCYGDTLAKTPNIDALAKRGARFERAYCTFPLCGPSRNSILTGLYPNSTDIFNNGQIFRQSIPKQKSLSQNLRLQGYLAARVGKLYHYNVPNSIGTNGHDDPASWEIEINPAGDDRMVEHPKIHSLVPNQFGGTLSWLASESPESFHTDAMQAEDAAWVLERCARTPDRPFLLAVGFFRPHTPYVAPKAYFDLHSPSSMRVANSVSSETQRVSRAAFASAKKEQEKLDDETTREILQAYYASVSFMDAQVGKVLKRLDELGLTESTAIVFTSDHGYHLGEHGLWQKMSLFEQSARVPLLLVLPGITQGGSVVETPVSHVDLFPTLCAVTKTSPPENLQGQNLVPLCQDLSQKGRGWALTQVTRGGGKENRFFGYSLRTERWRYTEWDNGEKGRELYDHFNDAMEVENLVDKEEFQMTVKELRQLLHQAIDKSLPKEGSSPSVKPMDWAPNITDND